MKGFLCSVLIVFLPFCGRSFAEGIAATAVGIDQPPTLDGRLDESFWAQAEPLGDFHVWQDARGGRVSDTRVRLAYDNAWLYLGLECDHPLQHLVSAPVVRAHDGMVDKDESVELFFSSDDSGQVYYHFLLSSFNVRAEQRFVNGRRERYNWNLPWRSATMISEGGWTAEIAIPLFVFLEHGRLDRIRLNVMRNRRMPFVDAQNVITYETMDRSSWQPVFHSFHETGSFASLSPLEPDNLRMPFLASLEHVAVRPYFIKDGETFYAVDVKTRGANVQTGDVELVIRDRTLDGKEEQVVRHRFQQKGTDVTRLTVEVPAPSPGERTVVVELRDAALGETFQAREIGTGGVLNVMDAYLCRNYYTTEHVARVVAEMALPEGVFRGMRVAVMSDRGVLADRAAEEYTLVSFGIQEMEVGRHPITIALLHADGTRFSEIRTVLVKRAPNPGVEWKIDQINRVMLQPDGTPYFPFGPVMGGVRGADEATFQAIADAGCNTFFQWFRDDDPREVLDTARRVGLNVVLRLCAGAWAPINEVDLEMPLQRMSEERLGAWRDTARGWRGLKSLHEMLTYHLPTPLSAADKIAICNEYFVKTTPRATAYLERAKHYENLLAWNSIDEPGRDSDFIPGCLHNVYALASRIDGYRPVMLLYSSHIPPGDEWVDGTTDVLCTDPYWIPAMNPEEYGRGTPNFVSKITHWNDLRAAKFRQPVWSVPVGALWSGMVRSKRIISAPEQHCQNVLAIIHGARGLFWFSWESIGSSAYAWNSLRESVAMIKVIGPMAVQPNVRQRISYVRADASNPETYRDSPFLPERDEYPDVQGRLFRDPADGTLVLVAANTRPYPVTATFTVSGLSGSVRRVFAEQVLPVSDGAFIEELEPFAVRAYRLGMQPEGGVSLRLAALRPREIPPREQALLHNWRPGRKNVFPNPIFQEETIPGHADYAFYDGVVEDGPGMAKFGDKCLKLVAPESGYVNAGWSISPQHDRETPYVFSFWARGEIGGEVMHVWSPRPRKSFTLTPEWQRYESSFAVPPRIGRHDSIRFLIGLTSTDGGTAWLDGMQLEEGYIATEFEE